MTTDTQELVTINEAVALLGGRISAGTLDNWRAKRSKVAGPAFVMRNGRVFYVKASVLKFAETYPFRRKAVAGRAELAPVLALLLILVGIPLAIVSLGACTSAKKLVRLPEKVFVEGERAVHDFVGPRFETYVAADATLTEAEKIAIGKVIDDWELALANAEKAVEDGQ